MANANNEKIMQENAAKDEMLTKLGIWHSTLLGDSANNCDHLDQRKEYNHLLGIISAENDLPENPTMSSELSPADPPEDRTDPVNDEPQEDINDEERWLPEEEPLIEIHQPAAAASKKPEFTPPASPPDESVPDLTDIGQQMRALQATKKAIAVSHQLVHKLQQQQAEIEKQDQDLAMLRDKVREYENAERTWEQERQRQQTELAQLQVQLSAHQPVYNPEQLVCLNKVEHDIKFVERGKTVHHTWKWACLGCVAVLFITHVVWAITILLSKSADATTTPSPSVTKSSNLDLDFPPIPSLK